MQVYDFPDIPIQQCSGVLIDLDDTLYGYDLRHKSALDDVHSTYFADFPKERFFTLYRSARNLVTKRLSPQGACRSRLLAFQYIFEELGKDRPFVRAYEADCLYWNSFIQNMTCAPQALAFLERCKNAGLPVCVVSDMTTHVQIRKLEQLGLTGHIKYLVTSEEVGAEKPDPRMFREGMRKLGISRPQDTIMIGDSPSKDIQGAETLGIPAYLIDLAAS